MEQSTSQRQSARGSKDPVVRRKDVAGNSGAGKGWWVRADTAVGGQQNAEEISASGVTGRGRKEEGRNGNKVNNTKGTRELELRIKLEQKDEGESKGSVTVWTKENNLQRVTVTKARGKDVEVRKGGEDGETILQKAAGKAIRRGNEQSLGVEDYLTLLKLLDIKLPKGVVTLKVIEHSADQNIIKDAQAIIQDLESLQLKFVATPRLGCREVKHALTLKNEGKALEITRIIFFKNAKNAEKSLRATWQTNSSNTGRGFRMKDLYRTTPISTPAMYATVATRSWTHLEASEDFAKITKGVKVNIQDLEKMKFLDESSFRQAESSPQKFGKYFQNPADEKECLKFFHEQTGIVSKYESLTYTKGNKVDFGFLTGNVDFIMEAKLKVDAPKSRNKSTSNKDKIIIECKGTTGDMVGTLFTKPSGGSRQVEFIKAHEYWYQAQAYMYILNRVKSETPSTVQTVMVVRHYHTNSKDGSKSSDFYWNYLRKDRTKQIDQLRIFCQEEVLPRFLAVITLIFQKETEIVTKS